MARPPITKPGLYFKWPLIETVVDIDKRILDLELPSQEVIASDQKRLVVDAFTRYRVTDPLRFYQSVNNVAGANMRLTSIVNSDCPHRSGGSEFRRCGPHGPLRADAAASATT